MHCTDFHTIRFSKINVFFSLEKRFSLMEFGIQLQIKNVFNFLSGMELVQFYNLSFNIISEQNG